MQTIGCLVNDGEELTNYFVTLEKVTKPVNEFLEHPIWTRVRIPAGPLIKIPKSFFCFGDFFYFYIMDISLKQLKISRYGGL